MKVLCFHSKLIFTSLILIIFQTAVFSQTPENDDPCPTDPNPPIDLTSISFHIGTTCEATFDYANIDCGSATESASVWYTFDPSITSEQGLDITLSPAGGSDDAEGPITIEVYKGAANAGCSGFASTLISSCSNTNALLQIANNFFPNEFLYIKVTTDAADSQCGEFKIAIDGESCGEFADFCDDITSTHTITPTTSEDFEVSYSCISSCIDYASPDATATDGCSEFAINPTVWFRIDTDGEGQQLYTTVTTTGNWQPVWSIYKGDDCGNLSIQGTSGQTCSNEDVTPDLFQVQIDPLFDTYWMAVSVDPNSIPPTGIADGNIEVCASTVINGIVCLGTLEEDCADNSLVIEVTGREVEGGSLDGPFCPGETVDIHIEFFYDAAETGGDWLSGIIPKFGSGWDIAALNFSEMPRPFGNGMEAGWYAEGGDCAPLIQEDVAHLCTYVNEYGNLELCNNLCEPCPDCPSSGMTNGDPLPGGFFWVTNGASAGCDNDCSPGEGYGIGSILAQVEWDFQLTVKSFDTSNDCYSNDDLQISFQTFSHGIVGCWEDPIGECIIDKSQFGPLWVVDCVLPAQVEGEDNFICNGDNADAIVLTVDGSPTTINVEYINNPFVTGESNHTFPGGSGTIDDILVNTTSDPQIVEYMAYSEDPSLTCNGNPKIIQVTVYPELISSLPSSILVCDGECIILSPEEIDGGNGGPYSFLWSNGQDGTEIEICPTSEESYSVTVSDSNGCTSVSSVDIYVNPPIDLYLLPSYNVCKDDEFNPEEPEYYVCVDFTGGSTPISIEWNVPVGLVGAPFGSVNECFAINEVASSEFLGDFTLTAIATDDNGCTEEISSIISVTPELVLTAGVLDYECNETEATITATGIDNIGNAVTLFFLYGGCPSDSTNSLGDFLGEAFSNSGTVNFPPVDLLSYECYTIVGLVESGCQAVQTINIPIIEGTPIEIEGTATICQGESSTMTITNDSLFVEFFWTPNVSVSETATVSPDTTTTYFVEALDQFGCVSQQVFTVTVIPEGSPLCANPCENQIADYQVTGIAYADLNGNGIKEANEPPLSNVLIKDVISDLTVFTNVFGVYILPVMNDDVQIQATINQADWVNPQIDTLIFVDVPCFDNLDFGFIPSAVEENIQISATNTITRCDWETTFFITVENLDHEDFEGKVEFTYDSKALFFNTTIPNVELVGNKVIFETGIISGHTSKTFNITLKMPGGSSVLPMLNFRVEVFEEDVLLDSYAYAEQLRCSYDPNDKKTHPDRPGDSNPTLKEENLNYTIRFQNNGNDTAFHVQIVDILDPGIIKSSIRFINASHPFEACISGDTLIMDFPNILLMDSTTNYDASQGFISLSCAIDSTILTGEIIENTADIIFDSNDPIITNTVLNTIVEQLCTDTTINISANFCEGETYLGYDESGIYQDTFSSQYGCDSIVVLELWEIIPVLVSLPDFLLCEPGQIEVLDSIYVFETSGEYEYMAIGDSGCVETMGSFNVEIIEVDEIFESFTICDGDLLSYDNQLYEFDSSGVYEFEIEGVSGCIETILQFDITIITAEENLIDVEICEGIVFSYEDQTFEFDSSGIYTYLIEGPTGCDEVELIFDVLVNPTTFIETDTTICEGQNYMGLETTGTYELDSFDPVTGCLVIENVNLEVLPITDPACINSTQEEVSDAIKVFPIPTDRSLYVSATIPVLGYSLHSSTGQIFKSESVPQSNNFSFDTQELANGLYFLILNTNQGKAVKKVIIHR